MKLKPGAPGRAADVVSAAGRIVAALKSSGYADAKAEPRQVTADFATDTLTPTYKIEPGGIVRLGGVRVVTKGRTRPSWVQRLAPWAPGADYRPKDIAELERRLNDTGIYRSVEMSVSPPDQALPDGARPVEANLVDRDPVSVQLGAS
jgi:translocation and assembly module TamA